MDAKEGKESKNGESILEFNDETVRKALDEQEEREKKEKKAQANKAANANRKQDLESIEVGPSVRRLKNGKIIEKQLIKYTFCK